jgi:N-(2-amino-2-carboxyethyl)-L-glutamate synthase
MIPGLGTGTGAPLLDRSYVDEVVLVEEVDTIRACRRLASRGFLFGGSTGTVVSGALDWLGRHDALELTAVAIGPDLGERYLETVYQDDWVRDLYGEEAFSSEGPTAGSRPPELRSRRARRRVCRVPLRAGRQIAELSSKELS